MKITYTMIKESDGGFGFNERAVFYKDGAEFARMDPKLITDISAWTSMTREDAINEVTHALRYELNDPTLNEELDALLTKIYKIDNL